MVCSEGSVGMPQNMMLVNMVQSNKEKQQDTRCTRVKVLHGGRLMTENQMCPSRKSLAVFMKNRLLEGGKWIKGDEMEMATILFVDDASRSHG